MCIRVNLSNSQDPELLRACKESGVQFCELGLPPVLTLWVDPGEVACRIGEDNPCFSVARFPNNSKSGACADLMAVEDSSSSGSDSDSSSGMHPLFDFPPGMLRPCYQEKVISSLELTKASEALQERPGSFLFSVVFVHILYIKKMSRMQVIFFILSIFSIAHDAVKVQENHRSASCIAFRVYSVCREPFAVLCMGKKNPYSLFTAAMRPDASN
ncbi:protein BTG3 isoform X2 [Hippocampus comes]|uniref:protein BTG3 isoform X2 n=1 Tax=Hippocampus comes TaxID=109280 RepID=UPI00094F1962|nr:PREDICTED: protein BTG3-like isoform X2 [Hippocampus comes]